jgi:hypothetical protein
LATGAHEKTGKAKRNQHVQSLAKKKRKTEAGLSQTAAKLEQRADIEEMEKLKSFQQENDNSDKVETTITAFDADLKSTKMRLLVVQEQLELVKEKVSQA